MDGAAGSWISRPARTAAATSASAAAEPSASRNPRVTVSVTLWSCVRANSPAAATTRDSASR